MIAAPDRADPDATARTSMLRVIPHVRATEASPSMVGPMAELVRLFRRTRWPQLAGRAGVIRRNQWRPRRSRARTSMTTPAVIWTVALVRGVSCTALPNRPRAAPRATWETSLPAKKPPTGSTSSTPPSADHRGVDGAGAGGCDERRLHSVQNPTGLCRGVRGRPASG